MESNLNIRKEGEKVILHDESIYESVDDFYNLYNLMSGMHDLRKSNYDKLLADKQRLEEEIAIGESRLKQVTDFMEANGIQIPKDDKELEDNQN